MQLIKETVIIELKSLLNGTNNKYKERAYSNAIQVIQNMTEDEIIRIRNFSDLPGIGKSLALKIFKIIQGDTNGQTL